MADKSHQGLVPLSSQIYHCLLFKHDSVSFACDVLMMLSLVTPISHMLSADPDFIPP
jgi:hypothetical protein